LAHRGRRDGDRPEDHPDGRTAGHRPAASVLRGQVLLPAAWPVRQPAVRPGSAASRAPDGLLGAWQAKQAAAQPEVWVPPGGRPVRGARHRRGVGRPALPAVRGEPEVPHAAWAQLPEELAVPAAQPGERGAPARLPEASDEEQPRAASAAARMAASLPADAVQRAALSSAPHAAAPLSAAPSSVRLQRPAAQPAQAGSAHRLGMRKMPSRRSALHRTQSWQAGRDEV